MNWANTILVIAEGVKLGAEFIAEVQRLSADDAEVIRIESAKARRLAIDAKYDEVLENF